MIRQMTIHDYPAIYQLWLSCKGMGLNDVDDSESGIARFLERNPTTCFVSETDGKLNGVILSGSDGRRGYIYHTAVHPSCRKQGIGSALVRAELNAFWEKQGFTVRNDLVYRNQSLVEIMRIDT